MSMNVHLVGPSRSHAEVDPDTKGLVALSDHTHNIRRGRTFMVGLNAEAIPDNNSIALLMTRTADDPIAHMRCWVCSGGLSRVRINEGPIVTNPGSAAAGQNLSREPTIVTPEITVTQGPTVSDAGTPLLDQLTPFNVETPVAGGNTFVLHALTNLIQMTNLNGDNQWLSIVLEWTEIPL